MVTINIYCKIVRHIIIVVLLPIRLYIKYFNEIKTLRKNAIRHLQSKLRVQPRVKKNEMF